MFKNEFFLEGCDDMICVVIRYSYFLFKELKFKFLILIRWLILYSCLDYRDRYDMVLCFICEVYLVYLFIYI